MRLWFYYFCRFLLAVSFKSLFFFRACGRNHIPLKGGCIIAANHLSFLDPAAVAVGSARPVNFMARHDLFRNSWFAALIERLNAFPVERGKGDLKAMRTALEKLKAGNVLLIFPEGRRSREGNLLAPEPGIALLAAHARVPVVPALITGTEKAMPAGSNDIFVFTPVRIVFGPPMHFPGRRKNPGKDDYLRFSGEILERIRRLKTAGE